MLQSMLNINNCNTSQPETWEHGLQVHSNRCLDDNRCFQPGRSVSNDSFGRFHALFTVYPAEFCAIILPDDPPDGNSLENLWSVFEAEPLRDRRNVVAVSNRWTVSGSLKRWGFYLSSIILVERLQVHESVAAFEPVSPNRIWIRATDGEFHGNGFWSTLDRFFRPFLLETLALREYVKFSSAKFVARSLRKTTYVFLNWNLEILGKE